MKNTDKIILDIYREAYKEATPSADFDELMARGDGVNFDAYYLPSEKLDEIVEKHLKYKREHTRKTVRFHVYLGCSPTSRDFYYTLEKVGVRFSKESSRIRWIEWNEDGTFKQWYDFPAIGRSLIMSPFNHFYTWMTTPITEIIHPEDCDHPVDLSIIHFKTENSEYKLERKNVD